MKKLLLFALILFSFKLNAQNYFQQKVNYTIKVTLDPIKKTLSAHETVQYINNSPDTLHFIYFHLWPNAYSSSKTALSKQLAARGNGKLYFNHKKNGGYIDSLDFAVDGKKIKWEFTDKSHEIAKLTLDKPLAPGDTILVSTPFFVKIPSNISRMGYSNGRFQISQWYPKPAVYDRYGWHTFPYLDFGEFYSEFGSFDVYITVPKDYVVAATGVLQNPEERQWLNDLSMNSLRGYEYENPAKGRLKTLHYHQDSIHDFAWFTAYDYYVSRSNVTLPNSGRQVETWAFYTEDNLLSWMTAVNYVDSAIYYYSQWVGDYPYKVCTAVEGALKAGGGMEYPTITVIAPGMGDGLEEVIAHEVGHNWFYGILGFNEREYPFLDEGINTFYEKRYTEQRRINSMFDVIGNSLHLTYQLMTYFDLEQPLNLHSQKYNVATYQTDVYMQASSVFYYLYKYLGQDKFDSIMQGFFEKWKFKHPYPEDLENYFKANCNKNLDWFFDDIIKTNKIADYKVRIGNNKVVVKKTGQFTMPMPVMIDSNLVWTEPDAKKQVFDQKAEKVILDPDFISPDFRSYNNTYYKKLLFPRKEKLLPHLFFTLQPYNKTSLSFVPLMAYNNEYDKHLYGILLHNITIPLHQLSYVVVPFYSQATGKIEGSIWTNYKIPASNGRPGLNFSIYADNYMWYYNNTLVENDFKKFKAKLGIDFRKKDGSDKFSKKLIAEYIKVQSPATPEAQFTFPKYYSIYRGQFKFNRLMSQLHPVHFELTGQITDLGNNQYFRQFWTSFDYMFHYVSFNSGLKIRLFAGKNVYINGLSKEADMALDIKTFGRFADYSLDNKNIWAHQFQYGQGGFAYYYPNSLMQDGMASINITSTLPMKKFTWIKAYASAAYGSPNGNNWQEFHEYGLLFSFGSIDIYLPLGGTFKDYNYTITDKWYNHYRFSISSNFDMSRLLKF